jgi:hypothetical protein
VQGILLEIQPIKHKNREAVKPVASGSFYVGTRGKVPAGRAREDTIVIYVGFRFLFLYNRGFDSLGRFKPPLISSLFLPPHQVAVRPPARGPGGAGQNFSPGKSYKTSEGGTVPAVIIAGL